LGYGRPGAVTQCADNIQGGEFSGLKLQTFLFGSGSSLLSASIDVSSYGYVPLHAVLTTSATSVTQ
jgi:hypothetical protein